MPSMKRIRPREGDDGEVEVLESASSALRASSKRPRLAADDINGVQSRASTIFDDDDLPSTQFQRHSGIREEYERTRDQVSVVPPEVDAARMEQMTQDRNIRKAMNAEFVSLPAENGILESILCTNFMCHTRLEVKFGPLINFIIGHNGSGKSAVLTAITLCLGGKATSTNRGQSLKGFVKEGSDQSTLQVKIKNRGSDAYKQETYGDSIIVERHFNTGGTSGFKIRNRDGRIISTKRSELDDICDFYALQLDNPVNVLTQDMARQFLNSSTPAEKYKFFIKGVQLEQLDQDYSLLGESLDYIDASLENHKEDCRMTRVKRDDAKTQFRRCEAQATLRERISTFCRKQAWAQIEAQEKEVAEHQETSRQRERRVAKLKADYDVAGEKYEEAQRTHEEVEQAVTRLRENEHKPLQEQHEAVKQKFDEVTSQIRSLHSEERKVHGELKGSKDKVSKHQKDVDEENQRLEEAHGGGEAAKRAEIEDAESSLEEAKSRKEEHDGRLPRLKHDERAAQGELTRAETTWSDRNKEHVGANNALRSLQNAGPKNEWAAYPPNTEKVVRAIARETCFKDKPVGPIGKHVRLLRPDWSSIVEKTLGGSLNGFVVSCKDDQALLSNIMRQAHCDKPTVFIVPSRPIDNVREPANHNTILKILEIDNHLVRNSLIINQGIDQQAIFDDSSEAMRLTDGKGLPMYVKALIAKHPTQAGHGIRFTVNASGTSRMSNPIDRWAGQPRMAMDDRAAINAQKDVVTAMGAQLHAAEQNKTRCQGLLVAASQAVTRNERDSKRMKLEIDRQDEQVEDLKNQLTDMRPQDGKLDVLRTELRTAQDQVEHFRSQLSEAVRQKEEVALSNKDYKADLDNLQRRLDEKDEAIAAAEKKREKWSVNKTKILRAKNEKDALVKGGEEALQDANNKHRLATETLADWTSQAEQVSARVPIEEGETYDLIDKKLRRMNSDLARSEAEIGANAEDLAAAALAAETAFKNAERSFRTENSLAEELLACLRTRRGRWTYFRSAISQRARCEFMNLLRERAFRGQMRFDHITKQLDLQVEPDATRRISASTSHGKRNSDGAEGRQTKTLSGGEKSFSTICMLLALWEAMGSPIRCLDEFDVFMDSVNRDISMKMMIGAARQSIGRQYILITPQAMGSAELGTDVRVIRLSDPERGQTVLELGGAAA